MDFDVPAWKDSTRSALAGWWDDLVAAGCFLTRLPLAGLSSAHTGLLARSVRAFPLVGIVVGVAGWAAFAVAPARDDGLGARAGQPDDSGIGWCAGIAVVVALLCLGVVPGLAALVVAAAAVAGLARLAQRQIGGYTGDVLGAAQQIGEIAVL